MAGQEKQLMTQKKAEVEELWATNTAHELQNKHMLTYHDTIHSAREDARGLHPQEGQVQRIENRPYLAAQAEHQATLDYSPAIHSRWER